jgi:hypothetical protein
MDFPSQAPAPAATQDGVRTSRPGAAKDSVNAGLRLAGFLLLLAVVFAGAHAVGSHLGPVSTGQTQSGGGSPMHMGGSGSMNMGGQPAPQARLRGNRP